MAYRVIGLLQTVGASSGGSDQDDVVYIPVTTAQLRLLGTTDRSINMMQVRIAGQDQMESVQDAITSLLRKRHRLNDSQEDDFTIRNMAQLQSEAKNITGILTLFLAGVAAISGVHQFANFRPGGRDFMGTKLQSVLADLVKQGTLTQEQSTRLLDFLKQQKPDPGTPLGELVRQGILTQKEADAIGQKMREAVQAEREKELRSALDALVAAGTIDESKADQLLTDFQQLHVQKEDSGAADRSNTPKAEGPFGYAIEQGLLTQEQADALLKQMRVQERSLRNEQLKAILGELVSAGTIEQSKADQVLSYLQKQETQHQAAAPGQAKGSNRVDPLSAAVSQGIITQPQADAV